MNGFFQRQMVDETGRASVQLQRTILSLLIFNAISMIFSANMVQLISGVISAIVLLIGFRGAVKRSGCHLLTFSIFTILGLILTFACVALMLGMVAYNVDLEDIEFDDFDGDSALVLSLFAIALLTFVFIIALQIRAVVLALKLRKMISCPRRNVEGGVAYAAIPMQTFPMYNPNAQIPVPAYTAPSAPQFIPMPYAMPVAVPSVSAKEEQEERDRQYAQALQDQINAN